MSEVKRFDFGFSTESGDGIFSFPDGEYVLYTDYQKQALEYTSLFSELQTAFDKVEKLQAENEELKQMGTVKQRMRFCEKNDDLQSKLDKAIEALKFYADHETYYNAGQIIDADIDDHGYGGTLARKTLAELEK